VIKSFPANLHILLTVVGALCALSARQLPNIILVMSDDHGYGDCGYTGHPFVQTPHLDAMAKSGVVFNRFYSSAPVCSPTRASLLMRGKMKEKDVK